MNHGVGLHFFGTTDNVTVTVLDKKLSWCWQTRRRV